MQRFRFQASTIEALAQSVLNECSRPGGCASSVVEQTLPDLGFPELAAADEALASWLIIAAAAKSSNDCRLSESLVQSSEWLDASEPAQRLWQVANLAVRLQTLEQRFTEELERQKREAIYHFAYGLSHELNNPLANIATRAGVLVRHELAVDRRQMLETIIDNAMRGSEMLGDLMLIARPPKMQVQSVDVGQWFASFVERARLWSSKRGVTIESSVVISGSVVSEPVVTEPLIIESGGRQPAGSIARFDPVAMNEALWCVTRNAIEVSRESDSIEIRTEIHNRIQPSSICWSVRDTGPGLSEVALRHCFDPYFSGREAGRGLGLGLSKALLIATAHGGTLTIANRLSGGCEALLTVPFSPDFEPDPGL